MTARLIPLQALETIAGRHREIVGTLPKGFKHRERGVVDAYVMYRFLEDVDCDEGLG